MVAKRDNVVGQRVSAPAHGHNPLEIMTQQDYTQHPITPPFELMNQWYKKACKDPYNGGKFIMSQPLKDICNSAAQWGADQELEACCEWLDAGLRTPYVAIRLRSDRRPKPPSLKEQALKALKVLPTPEGQVTLDITDLNTIRRALEQLSDTQ